MMNIELSNILKNNHKGNFEPKNVIKQEMIDFYEQDWQCHQENVDLEGENMDLLLSELYSVNQDIQQSIQLFNRNSDD